MRLGRFSKHVSTVLIGATAALFAGAQLIPGNDEPGPVLKTVTTYVMPEAARAHSSVTASAAGTLGSKATAALEAFASVVSRLSRPEALDDAFHSYFAFKAAHPDEVKKPYLYFVDYGLPANEPRGYVFDMNALRIVEGPFTVAHGRGSAATKDGVPTSFSNRLGSAATSLGLYLADQTYGFRGKAGGRPYSSIGLRLIGVSEGFNDNAYVRRVVAHGAPYVTAAKAGRSEGCPAMEPSRARRLLPKLANGGLVFLFAPDPKWLAGDPWLSTNAD